MYYYSDDKETNRFIGKLKYFFYIVVPLIVFIIFYIVIILKNFYPLTLNWEENKKLLSYNNEVLVYGWKHQNKEETSFYYERYRIYLDPPFKIGITSEEWNKFYDKESIQKRNQERERDFEILRIGLKLYRNKHYNYPISVNPDKIEWGTATQKKLKEVLYNVPADPDPLGKQAYYYQSSSGYSYAITMDFEEFDDYGRIKYSRKTYPQP